MRTIYHAESLIDAYLVKDALEQAGIPAFVSGEYLTGGVGQLPARDLVAVAVPDSCVDAATPVMRDIETLRAQSIESLDAADDPGGMLPASG